MFIAVLLLITASSSFADEAGQADAVVGYVTVTNSDGEVKRLKDGDSLEYGDIINTGEESSVTIVLASGETITLSALQTYTVAKGAGTGDDGSPYAERSLSTGSPTLSTATSAGGTSVTPGDGGSPTN